MTDSGLSTRLRQQSRRAGLMVGITMVLTIAICIFGAAVLFAWLSRPFSDLIPVMAPAAETPRAEETVDAGDAPPPAAQPEAQGQPAPTIAAAAIMTEPAPATEFEPTHQISPGDSINFRSGPSTADEIIVALSPATPLQYLDEQADSGGVTWMRFRNEAGQEGWVREIDTEPYQP